MHPSLPPVRALFLACGLLVASAPAPGETELAALAARSDVILATGAAGVSLLTRRTIEALKGPKVLADVSHKLLNKHMAIFLDNKLISDPVVQSELNTGNVMIHGDFDAKKANELMIVLKAGSLPVPLEVIENRSVEASLGAESVKAAPRCTR